MSTPTVRFSLKNIHRLKEFLTDREIKVLQMRCGMGEFNKKHTRTEIAKVISNINSNGKYICYERVRQIEYKALRKLRHPLAVGILIE